MSKLITFFIDFWLDLFINFEVWGKQKSLKNAGGVINFESFWCLVEHQILIKFWCKMGPKIIPKLIKNRPKIDTKIKQKID